MKSKNVKHVRIPASTMADFLIPDRPLPHGTKCKDCGRMIKEGDTYYRLKSDIQHITCYNCVWNHQPKGD